VTRLSENDPLAQARASSLGEFLCRIVDFFLCFNYWKL